MNAIGSIITGFFDVLVLPFGKTHQTLGLVWISLLTGVGMAYAFKITSNQKAIKKAKDRLKARILEMRLYQDDPVLIFKGLGGALRGNLVYLSNILVPFLVIVIPVVIVFMQLDGRYAKSHLTSDVTTILRVELKEGNDPFATDVHLETGDGVTIVGNPVRVAETREVDWRLRVASPGTHEITLTAAGQSYSFPLVAEKGYRMIGHVRQASSFLEPLLHFPLPAIPDESPFYSIHVKYPSARYPIFGWRVHWIVIFLVYSLISAAALKFALKIEI
ncbi:MAG: hypothetical protein JSW58_09010 [Candidatus Latescibacterota bacterium]|nr:MAG: hypothetical protein JSW58_09010 [Candidatus Latescibacterota bacterium]